MSNLALSWRDHLREQSRGRGAAAAKLGEGDDGKRRFSVSSPILEESSSSTGRETCAAHERNAALGSA